MIVRCPIFKPNKINDLEDDYCNANSGPKEKLPNPIIVSTKNGDLLVEDNTFIPYIDEEVKNRYIIGCDPCTENNNGIFINSYNKTDFITYMEGHFNNADWNDKQVWDNLKDKLRTTPDSHIIRISKVFRIDWSKIFKKGWLIWK